MIGARGPGRLERRSCSSLRAHQGPASLPLLLRRLVARRPPAPPSTPSSPATASRPPPAAGGLFASGPNTALSETCAASRRLDGRRAGGQPGARRLERRLAGLRAGQHDDRRRDALPQARRGRDGLRLRRARDHARRGQLPGLRELLGPGRLQAGDRARPRSRGARPAPTSTASRSTSSARPACQKLSGGEAAAGPHLARRHRAATTTPRRPIAAGPTSRCSARAPRSAACRASPSTFKDLGGGVAATGIAGRRADGLRAPVPNAGCRAPYRRLVPCPLTLATTLQFNPASVPDGPHQVRVFARDATGANVGYSASFPVTTSARGAVNGTNGSDQVKLSLGVRRAVSAGHRAPTPHTTLDVPYNAKTVAQGRLVNSAGQPVTGARLTVGTAVDRGVPTYADLPTDVVTDANGRFKVTLPRGPVVARAGPLLRARPGRDPGRPRRRARAGRDARDLRPSQAPHAPRPARRLPRARGRQLPPDRDPRRAPGPPPRQLRDAGHGRRPGRTAPTA